MSPELVIAGVVGASAVVEDLARRTVSNWIPAAALVGGLCCQTAANGWRGAAAAVLGVAAGFGIFLIFYLLGGMGGGDVKLMAGFGALLGMGRVLDAAFLVAVIGAFLAVAVLGVARLRRVKSAPRTIPYAPAIALGVWIALMREG